MTSYRRLCTFQGLKQELIKRGRATPNTAEAAARRWVTDHSLRTVTLNRLDGKGPVEYVIQDAPHLTDPRYRKTR